MGFFSLLFGFRSGTSDAQTPSEGRQPALEEITARSDPQEGWKDIFLSIVKTIKTDSTYQYELKGLYKGAIVGLRIDVRTGIQAGISGGKPVQAGFVKNGVSLASIGSESDAFIMALAELYGQPVPDAFSRNTLSATVFSLNERAVNLDANARYKLKLLFESADLYCEAYLNIDTEKGEIELAEKDEGYREPLIKLLSE